MPVLSFLTLPRRAGLFVAWLALSFLAPVAATGNPTWLPIAYRTYPAGRFAGCSNTGDDAWIEVLDRMDAHLRCVAAVSQNDQFPLRFPTLVFLGPGEVVKVYGQFKRAEVSVVRNHLDDGPPRACGSTARAMAGDPILVATGQNTGQLDQKGARHASWSYDDKGRAVMSERAGGVDRTEFAYGHHDPVGNLLEKDDFNQTRTCLVHDGRDQHRGSRRSK